MTGLPQKLAANLSAIVLLIVGAAFAGDGPTVHEPPEWAYPLNRSGPPKPLPDDGLLHVPGSSVARPIRALTDRFGAVDWHPDQHPPMPEVVEPTDALVPRGTAISNRSKLNFLPAGGSGV